MKWPSSTVGRPIMAMGSPTVQTNACLGGCVGIKVFWNDCDARWTRRESAKHPRFLRLDSVICAAAACSFLLSQKEQPNRTNISLRWPCFAIAEESCCTSFFFISPLYSSRIPCRGRSMDFGSLVNRPKRETERMRCFTCQGTNLCWKRSYYV